VPTTSERCGDPDATAAAAAGATPADPGLPPREQHMLEFERQGFRHAGAKEEAIRAQFGLSAARYYQLLNAALDLPEAILFDPMLVRRLQRLRDARTAARSARVLDSRDAAATHSELAHQ
jgi:hypothetical protein